MDKPKAEGLNTYGFNVVISAGYSDNCIGKINLKACQKRQFLSYQKRRFVRCVEQKLLIETMDRLSTVFQEVLERPDPFIGENSITRLRYFMEGYRRGIDGEGKLEAPLYYGFSNWLARRWHLVPEGFNTPHTWAEILLFMTGAETRAFEGAKELWYEYKAEMEKQEIS